MGNVCAALRVAFIDQTGDDSGGAQESFALLLRHLPDSIDPRVVLFHGGSYEHRLIGEGFNVTVFPVGGALSASKREAPLAGGILAAPVAVSRLASWLRSNDIDIVYTHTVKAHFIGAPAARLAGLHCVMHLRDILDGWPMWMLRRISAACSQHRIAISNAVARAYALPSTTVVLNPLELHTADPLPSRQRACELLGIPFSDGVMTVGIVGRINRWKRHDRFLRIASIVRSRVNARFIIAGSPIFRDADFAQELRATVSSLRLDDCVTFLPWTDEIRTVYAALDVHVNCSDREPFGRSIIEAAACGVPSVCFKDAGASEVLSDGVDGRVVACGDEEGFAAAVTALLTTPDKAALRRAARRLARQFDAALHADRVAEILQRAAA
jgi:glycosyltransferase involved in cell wall biosynthesis